MNISKRMSFPQFAGGGASGILPRRPERFLTSRDDKVKPKSIIVTFDNTTY